MENKKPKKHKLLLMLDEFPALGKMENLKIALSYMRGYGLRAFLICQDLDQLNEIYGDKNPILGHCNIRIAFAANTENTARRISALAGEATIVKKSKSFSDTNTDQISSGLSEIKRSLINPDEVLRLPETDQLIFYNKNTIYGKKIYFYKDQWFLEMSKMPPVLISDKLPLKNDIAALGTVVEYEKPKDGTVSTQYQANKEGNVQMNNTYEVNNGQCGIILKSKFMDLGYEGILIFQELNKRGILDDLNPKFTRVTPQKPLNENEIREVAKEYFDKIWEILNPPKNNFDKDKAP